MTVKVQMFAVAFFARKSLVGQFKHFIHLLSKQIFSLQVLVARQIASRVVFLLVGLQMVSIQVTYIYIV